MSSIHFFLFTPSTRTNGTLRSHTPSVYMFDVRVSPTLPNSSTSNLRPSTVGHPHIQSSIHLSQTKNNTHPSCLAPSTHAETCLIKRTIQNHRIAHSVLRMGQSLPCRLLRLERKRVHQQHLRCGRGPLQLLMIPTAPHLLNSCWRFLSFQVHWLRCRKQLSPLALLSLYHLKQDLRRLLQSRLPCLHLLSRNIMIACHVQKAVTTLFVDTGSEVKSPAGLIVNSATSTLLRSRASSVVRS